MTLGGDGTVGKALEVLDRVASYGRPVRFSELLADAPFPKATLYRHLQILVSQRMLAHDPDRGTYAPGMRLVRLAHAAWSQSSLAPIARAHVDRLSATVGETVHLAQLDHGQVLYVDKRNAAAPVPMFSASGKIGPAYCTGVGKAMLAYLDPGSLAEALAQQSWHAFTPKTLTSDAQMRAALDGIRARGHAFDDEEHEPGIICIAVAIRSRTGRPLGALSITASTAAATLSDLARHAPDLHAAADAIAREAEAWAFPEAPMPMTGPPRADTRPETRRETASPEQKGRQ